MIRPVAPFSEREREVLWWLFQGCTLEETGRRMGVSTGRARAHMGKAAAKINGPRWASNRERCLIWVGMEIGVQQYLAGLRMDDGRYLEPPPHLTEEQAAVVVVCPEPETLMRK